MPAINIPKGTSINAMKVLLTIDPNPSLADLKKYDRPSHCPEITQLKIIANNKPVEDLAGKKLNLDDVAIWFTRTEKMQPIWKAMTINYLENANGFHMVFSVTKAWAKENQVAVSDQSLERMFKRQIRGLRFNRPVTSDVNNDLVLGWISFTKQDNQVQIHDMQSYLEIVWPRPDNFHFRHFALGEIVEVLLTDAMRIWLNDGVTVVDIVSSRALRKSRRKHANDVYSRLPKRNGFAFVKELEVWRFDVTKAL